MRKSWAPLLLTGLFLAQTANATKSVKVIEPLPADAIGHVSVASTQVTIGETAGANDAKLDAKAAGKRDAAQSSAAGSATDGATRPSSDTYATLPLTSMLPLKIDDVTKAWGLTSGRPVKLAITVDTVKTANAGAAMLLGSADELAGTVAVLDAATGSKIGEFYVDVMNYHAGMLGLALRGSGVREKMATEFAKHVAEQLSGSKKPATEKAA